MWTGTPEMTNESKSLSDAIGGLAWTLTSPAKLAFAGYIILAYKGMIAVSLWQFFIVAGLFVALQMFHDDYFRIVLNRRANAK